MPSAMRFTKNEAMTTTQPQPPSGDLASENCPKELELLELREGGGFSRPLMPPLWNWTWRDLLMSLSLSGDLRRSPLVGETTMEPRREDRTSELAEPFSPRRSFSVSTTLRCSSPDVSSSIQIMFSLRSSDPSYGVLFVGKILPSNPVPLTSENQYNKLNYI